MPGGRKEQRCNDEKKLVRLAALCMVMLVGIGASSISSFAVTSHLVSFEAGEGSFANGQKVIIVSVDDGDCIPLDRIPKPIQPQGHGQNRGGQEKQVHRFAELGILL